MQLTMARSWDPWTPFNLSVFAVENGLVDLSKSKVRRNPEDFQHINSTPSGNDKSKSSSLGHVDQTYTYKNLYDFIIFM